MKKMVLQHLLSRKGIFRITAATEERQLILLLLRISTKERNALSFTENNIYTFYKSIYTLFIKYQKLKYSLHLQYAS